MHQTKMEVISLFVQLVLYIADVISHASSPKASGCVVSHCPYLD